jgi:NAD(P)-dependent dehydrogenase (short-subunit alcohol dehydrogenase family)
MSKSRKTVLLTGASRGIGKAIWEVLDSCGEYEILAPTREEMALDQPDSIDRYMQAHGHVDVLINNAGINILRSIDQIDEEAMRKMISVNLESPLRLIKHVAVGMKARRSGRILNVSSVWSIRSRESRTLYSMTKSGLNGITRAMARELGPYGILVNSICPGYVNTDLTRKNVPPAEQETIKQSIPLGRFAEPVEIARFVRFLVSDENTYITGQTLVIDGGFLV